MNAPPEKPSPAATSQDRRIRMLRTAMGPAIARALEDAEIVEVLLNPDGSLWVDRLGSGRRRVDLRLKTLTYCGKTCVKGGGGNESPVTWLLGLTMLLSTCSALRHCPRRPKA